jgi:DNA polymerase I
MLRLLQRGIICGFCVKDTKMFGVASRMGGKSSEGLYEQYAEFENRDLENFKEKMMQNHRHEKSGEYALPGVNIVTTAEECRAIAEVLMQNPREVVAWDTETIDLDIKQEAPVGKGKILCASFFAGPQFNFGRGPRVFIDNFGKNAGLINNFKEYFESEAHKKVWHNYGFDRHLFFNHGINVRGFGGDTMQMARLYDSGKMFNQYSLAALTSEYRDKIEKITVSLPTKLNSEYHKERPSSKKNPVR